MNCAMMTRWWAVLFVAVAAAATTNDTATNDTVVEAARRARIVRESAELIPTIRSFLCGKVSNASLLLVAVLGRDAAQLAQRAVGKLEGEGLRVAAGDAAMQSLRHAAETENFDFRQFDGRDAVVGAAVIAFWQELLAAYPRARLAVVLGAPHERPSKLETRVRLQRCARADAFEAGQAVAAYGSACPSAWQRAAVEDMVAAEMLDWPGVEAWDARDFRASEAPGGWRAFSTESFFSTTSPHPILLCPGQGTTATRSLAGALKLAKLESGGKNGRNDEIAHYNGAILAATAAAAEDDGFDWIQQFHKYRGVLDSPMPAIWQAMVLAFRASQVVLTVRDVYDRHYPSHVYVSGVGTLPQNARRRRASSSAAAGLCAARQRCDDMCRDRHQPEKQLELAGAASCGVDKLGDVDPALYARRTSAYLLGERASPKDMRHKDRVPVYHSACPSRIQVVKFAANTNRHVLRRVPSDRLLTLSIVDDGDGYERLCPFIGATKGTCSARSRGPFPRSKPEKSRRRLSSCLCQE